MAEAKLDARSKAQDGEPPSNDPETKYPVLVVCALIVRNGNVLLERRAPTGVAGLDRMYDLPGGKVENGEHPADAIVREIREELGVIIKPTALIPDLRQSAWDYGKGVRHWILAVYRCDIVSGEPRCNENLAWLKLADISEANTLAADASIIRKWVEADQPVPEKPPVSQFEANLEAYREPSVPASSTDPFSKGYKNRYGEPVSDACGDGLHSQCTQDLAKCHCTVRCGHNDAIAPHAYMSVPAGETAPDQWDETAWHIADRIVRDYGRASEGSASWQVHREEIRQELLAFQKLGQRSSKAHPYTVAEPEGKEKS